MKLFYLIWLALFTGVFALSEDYAGSSIETHNESIIAGDQDIISEEQQERKFVNLNVTYTIIERPDFDLKEILEFAPDQLLTLAYSLYNGENSSVSIVGFSGNVYTLPDGYYAANISETSIQPLNVLYNETTSFSQEVKLVLPEGKFYVEPVLIVEKDSETMRVAVQPIMVEIVPLPLSFFNLQFLSVQITLLACIGGMYYYFISRSTPITIKKTKFKAVKVDETWLPDNYKK